MLAVTEPGVHIITAMVATQLLKTALLENVAGYFAHLDPCPMLLLQPKEAAAEQFSKERITPLIRCTPVLRELMGSPKTRTADETLLFKGFPGGFLALAGAGSPDNLARRPIRVLLCDEVDKYPVTREGDPIALAEERTATFGVNWLSLRVCSPTLEGECRIDTSYGESDQRRASVACPHCAQRLFLDFFRHVQWDKDGAEHRPETARIYCDGCGVAWSEGERLRALATVQWHQTRPFTCCGVRHVPLDDYDRALRAGDADPVAAVWDWWSGPRHAVHRAKCSCCGAWPVSNRHAGFQAGKLFSPWQKDRPADIAAKWLAAQGDDERLKTWWNTQAALPYRSHIGKELKLEALLARGEVWAAEVPDGVAVLTAGLDVQDDRIEAEIVGWGRNEESWSIEHLVLEGDPGEPALWDQVDALLRRAWHSASGRPFTIEAACIDSGGHHTQRVYDFAKARLGRKIWAIKGEAARNGQRSPIWPTKRPSARSKSSFRPIILGVNAAKDAIRSRLALEAAGPGFMHFPADRDVGYYAQLTAERLILKVAAGARFRVWELPSGKANEALDCRVYAYGALCGLLHFGLKLNRRADHVAGETAAAPPPPAASRSGPVLPASGLAPAGAPTPPKPRGSRWAR